MRVVPGVWLGVVVGAVEGDVGVVGVPAAGHRDVEGFPGGGGFDEHVRGVGGGALGAVGGDCVAEVDVFGDVGGWEEDAAAEPVSGLADDEGGVVADVGDGPEVAVAYPVPPTGGAESAVVAAGDDRVADSRSGAVAQFDLAAGGRGPSRIRSARARVFRANTSSRVSAISTETRPWSRLARHAV